MSAMYSLFVILFLLIPVFGIDLEPLNMEFGNGNTLLLSGYSSHEDFNTALLNEIGRKVRDAAQATLVNNKQEVDVVDKLLTRIDYMEYTFLQIFHSLAIGDVSFTNQLIELYSNLDRQVRLSDYFKSNVTFLTESTYGALNSAVSLSRNGLKPIPEEIIDAILSVADNSSVFEEATRRGNVGVIKWLQHHVNDTERCSALEVAWHKQKYDVVKALIKSNITFVKPGMSVVSSINSKGEGILHLAAESRNRYFVASLLESGAQVNIFAESGDTPLLRAVKNNDILVAKMLIEKQADVNAADKSGKIPLHEAAKNGNHDMVKLLLASGSLVDKETEQGLTPLLISEKYVLGETIDYLFWNKNVTVKFLHKDLRLFYFMTSYEGIKSATRRRKIYLDRILEQSLIAKELLLRGEKTNIPDEIKSKVLHLVLTLGITTLAQSVLNLGAKLDPKNFKTKIIFRDAIKDDNHELAALMLNEGMPENTEFNGISALQVAADHGSVTTFNLLIERGADINKVTKYIGTMLHAASEGGKESLVRYLLDKGYRVNAPDKAGNTPLFYAAIFGNLEIVKLLLDRKANPKARNSDNETALHYATYSNDTKILNILIEKGFEVEARNNNGETPIFQAAKSGYTGSIDILLKAGAVIDAKDNANRTPLEISILRGNINATRVLLDYGMNPNTITSQSRTFLHLAVSSGKVELVELLIKKGALVNTPDSDGRNALHLAVDKNSLKIVQLLVTSGISINAKDKDGRTPLDHAITKCSQNIVLFLVTKGAKGNELANPNCVIVY